MTLAAHTITGPGAVAFGASDARVAYQVAVLFTMNQSVDGPALTQTGPITDAVLAPAKAAMTPNAFADLKAFADKANAGDEESKNQLGLIVATDLVRGGDNLTYRNDTAPVVSRKTFGSAGSTVAGKNLGVQFSAVIDYRLLNDKKGADHRPPHAGRQLRNGQGRQQMADRRLDHQPDQGDYHQRLTRAVAETVLGLQNPTASRLPTLPSRATSPGVAWWG